MSDNNTITHIDDQGVSTIGFAAPIDLARDDSAVVRQSPSTLDVAAPPPDAMWAMLHECMRVLSVLYNGSLRTHPDLEEQAIHYLRDIPPLTRG